VPHIPVPTLECSLIISDRNVFHPRNLPYHYYFDLYIIRPETTFQVAAMENSNLDTLVYIATTQGCQFPVYLRDSKGLHVREL